MYGAYFSIKNQYAWGQGDGLAGKGVLPSDVEFNHRNHITEERKVTSENRAMTFTLIVVTWHANTVDRHT